MDIALKFLTRVGIWAAGLLVLALLAAGLSGDLGFTLHLTRWISGALALAAFPAGISVATRVIDWSAPRLRPALILSLAAGLVALVAFAMRGYVGPALVASTYADPAAHAEIEPAALPFHERLTALEEAEARAEAGPQTVAAWLPANRIGWELDGTVTGAILAWVLAWVGVLTGVWARWTDRPELRQAQYWGLGLFLVVTGYLMGENGYELILLKMTGPAYVTAWFPLISPGMLMVGLAYPTVSRVLRGRRADRQTTGG